MTVPRGKPHWWTQTQSSLPLCKSSGHSSTEKIKRKSAYVSSLAIGKLLWMPIAQSQVTHFNWHLHFCHWILFICIRRTSKKHSIFQHLPGGNGSLILMHFYISQGRLVFEMRIWDRRKVKGVMKKNKRNKKPGQKALNMFKSHHILSGSYNYTSACHKEFKSDEWIF